MKKLLMVLGLASMALVGCKKKGGGMVPEATKLKERMCACPDMACIDQVQADLKAFRQANRKEPSDDDKKKLDDLKQEYEKCHDDLVVKYAPPPPAQPPAEAAPTTPPPAPAPAPTPP